MDTLIYSNKTFHTLRNKGIPFVVPLLFLLNYFGYFGIRQIGLHWWAMYLCVPIVLVYNYFSHRHILKIHLAFHFEIYCLLLFCACGIVSTFYNGAAIIDSIYTIVFRIIPVTLLMYVFDIALKYSVHRHKSKFTAFRLWVFFLPLVIFAGVQYFVFGFTGDRLGSFAGHAHSFSMISLFSGFHLLITDGRNFLFSLPLFLLAMFLSIVGDVKLGIVVFLFSFVPGYVLMSLLYKGNFARLLGITIFSAVFLSSFFVFTINKLPKLYQRDIERFSSIQWGFMIRDIDVVLPDNFELIKGYLQIPTRVFTEPFHFFFGVGPGNFATNIAKAKRKPLYKKYVEQYRDQLDDMGFGTGTFSKRWVMLINIITEFGIIGTVLYLTIFIRLILFPLQIAKSLKKHAASKANNRLVYFYCFLISFYLLELPFFPILEQGLHMSILAYFGFELINIFKHRHFSQCTISPCTTPTATSIYCK